eukprot:TRINITY_DN2637_c0_g1_i4.p1 TRINITY_DN2637_c0_g1~~TRINITY_DN2637_c0_g1_i4.p1  ORF type:complete len:5172 (+),score=1164.48 TRINITY_DN2637_c0_g1_i4:910-15516(+)
MQWYLCFRHVIPSPPLAPEMVSPSPSGAWQLFVPGNDTHLWGQKKQAVFSSAPAELWYYLPVPTAGQNAVLELLRTEQWNFTVPGSRCGDGPGKSLSYCASADNLKLVPRGRPCTYEWQVANGGDEYNYFGSWHVLSDGSWKASALRGLTEGSSPGGVGLFGTRERHPLIQSWYSSFVPQDRFMETHKEESYAFIVVPQSGDWEVCFSAYAQRAQLGSSIYTATLSPGQSATPDFATPVWRKVARCTSKPCKEPSVSAYHFTVLPETVGWVMTDLTPGSWGPLRVSEPAGDLDNRPSAVLNTPGVQSAVDYWELRGGGQLKLVPASRFADTVAARPSPLDSVPLGTFATLGCWDPPNSTWPWAGAGWAAADGSVAYPSASWDLSGDPSLPPAAREDDATAADTAFATVWVPAAAGEWAVCYHKGGDPSRGGWRRLRWADGQAAPPGARGARWTRLGQLYTAAVAPPLAHTPLVPGDYSSWLGDTLTRGALRTSLRVSPPAGVGWELSDTRAGTWGPVRVRPLGPEWCAESASHTVSRGCVDVRAWDFVRTYDAGRPTVVDSAGSVLRLVRGDRSCDYSAFVNDPTHGAESADGGQPECNSGAAGWEGDTLGVCAGRSFDGVTSDAAFFITVPEVASSGYRVCFRPNGWNWRELPPRGRGADRLLRPTADPVAVGALALAPHDDRPGQQALFWVHSAGVSNGSAMLGDLAAAPRGDCPGGPCCDPAAAQRPCFVQGTAANTTATALNRSLPAASPEACQRLCQQTAGCRAFEFALPAAGEPCVVAEHGRGSSAGGLADIRIGSCPAASAGCAALKAVAAARARGTAPLDSDLDALCAERQLCADPFFNASAAFETTSAPLLCVGRPQPADGLRCSLPGDAAHVRALGYELGRCAAGMTAAECRGGMPPVNGGCAAGRVGEAVTSCRVGSRDTLVMGFEGCYPTGNCSLYAQERQALANASQAAKATSLTGDAYCRSGPLCVSSGDVMRIVPADAPCDVTPSAWAAERALADTHLSLICSVAGAGGVSLSGLARSYGGPGSQTNNCQGQEEVAEQLCSGTPCAAASDVERSGLATVAAFTPDPFDDVAPYDSNASGLYDTAGLIQLPAAPEAGPLKVCYRQAGMQNWVTFNDSMEIATEKPLLSLVSPLPAVALLGGELQRFRLRLPFTAPAGTNASATAVADWDIRAKLVPRRDGGNDNCFNPPGGTEAAPFSAATRLHRTAAAASDLVDLHIAVPQRAGRYLLCARALEQHYGQNGAALSWSPLGTYSVQDNGVRWFVTRGFTPTNNGLSRVSLIRCTPRAGDADDCDYAAGSAVFDTDGDADAAKLIPAADTCHGAGGTLAVDYGPSKHIGADVVGTAAGLTDLGPADGPEDVAEFTVTLPPTPGDSRAHYRVCVLSSFPAPVGRRAWVEVPEAAELPQQVRVGDGFRTRPGMLLHWNLSAALVPRTILIPDDVLAAAVPQNASSAVLGSHVALGGAATMYAPDPQATAAGAAPAVAAGLTLHTYPGAEGSVGPLSSFKLVPAARPAGAREPPRAGATWDWETIPGASCLDPGAESADTAAECAEAAGYPAAEIEWRSTVSGSGVFEVAVGGSATVANTSFASVQGSAVPHWEACTLDAGGRLQASLLDGHWPLALNGAPGPAVHGPSVGGGCSTAQGGPNGEYAVVCCFRSTSEPLRRARCARVGNASAAGGAAPVAATLPVQTGRYMVCVRLTPDGAWLRLRSANGGYALFTQPPYLDFRPQGVNGSRSRFFDTRVATSSDGLVESAAAWCGTSGATPCSGGFPSDLVTVVPDTHSCPVPPAAPAAGGAPPAGWHAISQVAEAAMANATLGLFALPPAPSVVPRTASGYYRVCLFKAAEPAAGRSGWVARRGISYQLMNSADPAARSGGGSGYFRVAAAEPDGLLAQPRLEYNSSLRFLVWDESMEARYAGVPTSALAEPQSGFVSSTPVVRSGNTVDVVVRAARGSQPVPGGSFAVHAELCPSAAGDWVALRCSAPAGAGSPPFRLLNSVGAQEHGGGAGACQPRLAARYGWPADGTRQFLDHGSATFRLQYRSACPQPGVWDQLPNPGCGVRFTARPLGEGGPVVRSPAVWVNVEPHWGDSISVNGKAADPEVAPGAADADHLKRAEACSALGPPQCVSVSCEHAALCRITLQARWRGPADYAANGTVSVGPSQVDYGNGTAFAGFVPGSFRSVDREWPLGAEWVYEARPVIRSPNADKAAAFLSVRLGPPTARVRTRVVVTVIRPQPASALLSDVVALDLHVAEPPPAEPGAEARRTPVQTWEPATPDERAFAPPAKELRAAEGSYIEALVPYELRLQLFTAEGRPVQAVAGWAAEPLLSPRSEAPSGEREGAAAGGGVANCVLAVLSSGTTSVLRVPRTAFDELQLVDAEGGGVRIAGVAAGGAAAAAGAAAEMTILRISGQRVISVSDALRETAAPLPMLEIELRDDRPSPENAQSAARYAAPLGSRQGAACSSASGPPGQAELRSAGAAWDGTPQWGLRFRVLNSVGCSRFAGGCAIDWTFRRGGATFNAVLVTPVRVPATGLHATASSSSGSVEQGIVVTARPGTALPSGGWLYDEYHTGEIFALIGGPAPTDGVTNRDGVRVLPAEGALARPAGARPGAAVFHYPVGTLASGGWGARWVIRTTLPCHRCLFTFHTTWGASPQSFQSTTLEGALRLTLSDAWESLECTLRPSNTAAAGGGNATLSGQGVLFDESGSDSDTFSVTVEPYNGATPPRNTRWPRWWAFVDRAQGVALPEGAPQLELRRVGASPTATSFRERMQLHEGLGAAAIFGGLYFSGEPPQNQGSTPVVTFHTVGTEYSESVEGSVPLRQLTRSCAVEVPLKRGGRNPPPTVIRIRKVEGAAPLCPATDAAGNATDPADCRQWSTRTDGVGVTITAAFRKRYPLPAGLPPSVPAESADVTPRNFTVRAHYVDSFIYPRWTECSGRNGLCNSAEVTVPSQHAPVVGTQDDGLRSEYTYGSTTLRFSTLLTDGTAAPAGEGSVSVHQRGQVRSPCREARFSLCGAMPSGAVDNTISCASFRLWILPGAGQGLTRRVAIVGSQGLSDSSKILISGAGSGCGSAPATRVRLSALTYYTLDGISDSRFVLYDTPLRYTLTTAANVQTLVPAADGEDSSSSAVTRRFLYATNGVSPAATSAQRLVRTNDSALAVEFDFYGLEPWNAFFEVHAEDAVTGTPAEPATSRNTYTWVEPVPNRSATWEVSEAVGRDPECPHKRFFSSSDDGYRTYKQVPGEGWEYADSEAHAIPGVPFPIQTVVRAAGTGGRAWAFRSSPVTVQKKAWTGCGGGGALTVHDLAASSFEGGALLLDGGPETFVRRESGVVVTRQGVATPWVSLSEPCQLCTLALTLCYSAATGPSDCLDPATADANERLPVLAERTKVTRPFTVAPRPADGFQVTGQALPPGAPERVLVGAQFVISFQAVVSWGEDTKWQVKHPGASARVWALSRSDFEDSPEQRYGNGGFLRAAESAGEGPCAVPQRDFRAAHRWGASAQAQGAGQLRFHFTRPCRECSVWLFYAVSSPESPAAEPLSGGFPLRSYAQTPTWRAPGGVWAPGRALSLRVATCSQQWLLAGVPPRAVRRNMPFSIAVWRVDRNNMPAWEGNDTAALELVARGGNGGGGTLAATGPPHAQPRSFRASGGVAVVRASFSRACYSCRLSLAGQSLSLAVLTDPSHLVAVAGRGFEDRVRLMNSSADTATYNLTVYAADDVGDRAYTASGPTPLAWRPVYHQQSVAAGSLGISERRATLHVTVASAGGSAERVSQTVSDGAPQAELSAGGTVLDGAPQNLPAAAAAAPTPVAGTPNASAPAAASASTMAVPAATAAPPPPPPGECSVVLSQQPAASWPFQFTLGGAGELPTRSPGRAPPPAVHWTQAPERAVVVADGTSDGTLRVAEGDRVEVAMYAVATPFTSSAGSQAVMRSAAPVAGLARVSAAPSGSCTGCSMEAEPSQAELVDGVAHFRLRFRGSGTMDVTFSPPDGLPDTTPQLLQAEITGLTLTQWVWEPAPGFTPPETGAAAAVAANTTVTLRLVALDQLRTAAARELGQLPVPLAPPELAWRPAGCFSRVAASVLPSGAAVEIRGYFNGANGAVCGLESITGLPGTLTNPSLLRITTQAPVRVSVVAVRGMGLAALNFSGLNGTLADGTAAALAGAPVGLQLRILLADGELATGDSSTEATLSGRRQRNATHTDTVTVSARARGGVIRISHTFTHPTYAPRCCEHSPWELSVTVGGVRQDGSLYQLQPAMLHLGRLYVTVAADRLEAAFRPHLGQWTAVASPAEPPPWVVGYPFALRLAALDAAGNAPAGPGEVGGDAGFVLTPGELPCAAADAPALFRRGCWTGAGETGQCEAAPTPVCGSGGWRIAAATLGTLEGLEEAGAVRGLEASLDRGRAVLDPIFYTGRAEGLIRFALTTQQFSQGSYVLPAAIRFQRPTRIVLRTNDSSSTCSRGHCTLPANSVWRNVTAQRPDRQSPILHLLRIAPMAPFDLALALVDSRGDEVSGDDVSPLTVSADCETGGTDFLFGMVTGLYQPQIGWPAGWDNRTVSGGRVTFPRLGFSGRCARARVSVHCTAHRSVDTAAVCRGLQMRTDAFEVGDTSSATPPPSQTPLEDLPQIYTELGDIALSDFGEAERRRFEEAMLKSLRSIYARVLSVIVRFVCRLRRSDYLRNGGISDGDRSNPTVCRRFDAASRQGSAAAAWAALGRLAQAAQTDTGYTSVVDAVVVTDIPNPADPKNRELVQDAHGAALRDPASEIVLAFPGASVAATPAPVPGGTSTGPGGVTAAPSGAAASPLYDAELPPGWHRVDSAAARQGSPSALLAVAALAAALPLVLQGQWHDPG